MVSGFLFFPSLVKSSKKQTQTTATFCQNNEFPSFDILRASQIEGLQDSKGSWCHLYRPRINMASSDICCVMQVFYSR